MLRVLSRNALEFEILPQTLEALRKENDRLTLLDVREPWEYQLARIEGSKHIPMGDIPSRAHQELAPDAHIVVVCHHGVRSLNVTHWLRQQGFENVQSLRGGIDRWSRSIDPKIPVY